MKDFNSFYNDTYKTFCSTCEYKNLLSEKPIEYENDSNMTSHGEYSNNKIKLKSVDISTDTKELILGGIIYHELTHYYDEKLFELYNYSTKNIHTLMMTYSEMHGSYNEILYLLGFPTLKIIKQFDMKNKIYPNMTLAEFCAAYMATFSTEKINTLTFKNCMYFIGAKKVLRMVSKDKSIIPRVYNSNKIPEIIRQNIVNIENIFNTMSISNISESTFADLEINRLEAENKLTYKFLKDSHIPENSEYDKLRKQIENL